MGYLTDYSVVINGFENEDKAEFFYFKEFSKKSGIFHDFGIPPESLEGASLYFELNGYKWYDHDEMLKTLTSKWKEIMVEIVAEGEEKTDMWKGRWKNGKSEIVTAEIMFPDFKEIL